MTNMPSTPGQLSTVSILMGLHDDAGDIRSSIESCLAQRYPNVEIIVVDNCAGDASVEIARGYEPLVRVVAIPQPLSPSAERNVGLSHASGEFVLFHESCDLEFPDRLLYDLKVAYRSRADVVISINRWRKDGEPLIQAREPLRRRERRLLAHIVGISGDREQSLINMLQYGAPEASCILYRTSVVRALGGSIDYSEPYAGKELLFRALCRGATVAVNPRVTSIRRLRDPGQALQTPAEDEHANHLTLAKRYIAALEEAGLLHRENVRAALIAHVIARVYERAKECPHPEVASAALNLFADLGVEPRSEGFARI
jgi:Glycosyl transferase family 2